MTSITTSAIDTPLRRSVERTCDDLAMLVLAAESAPTRTILCAGAGTYEAAHITLTEGVHLGLTEDTPERLAARLAEVTDHQGEQVPQSGAAQGTNEVGKAFAAKR